MLNVTAICYLCTLEAAAQDTNQTMGFVYHGRTALTAYANSLYLNLIIIRSLTE